MKATILTMLAALLLASCGGPQQGGTPSSQAIPAQSENAAALRPFFQQLAQLQDTPRRQVHILQLGDSHTAADFMSGRLRERLQSQFGHAGRGLLPPGLPYRGIRQAGFKINATDRWDGSPGSTIRTAKMTMETRSSVTRRMTIRLNNKQPWFKPMTNDKVQMSNEVQMSKPVN